MSIVTNERASKSCQLWISEVAEQQVSDLKVPSRTRERKAHAHPSLRTTKKSRFNWSRYLISSRLVPSKVFSLVGFCALRRIEGESKILFAICNWKEATLSVKTSKTEIKKYFFIYYFDFSVFFFLDRKKGNYIWYSQEIVEISKNTIYMNYSTVYYYYYPLTVNGQLWPT